MEKGIPVFLVEVEMPEYCFISEAIEWMALGRTPQIQWSSDIDTDEPIDGRFDWGHMPDNFEPRLEIWWYDESEFESHNLAFDNDYYYAAEECYGQSPRYLKEKIAKYEAEPKHVIINKDGQGLDYHAEIITYYRKTLMTNEPLQKIVDNAEAQFEPIFELAWAKLFQLLHSGEIAVEALNFKKWDRLCGEDEHEKAGEFEVIEGKNFKLGFDWRQNEVAMGGVKYVAVRVSTSEIIKRHDSLLFSGRAASVTKFGEFYRTVPTGKKGIRRRPTGVNWSEMKDYLNTLVEQGKAPENREGCIYELISYGQKKWQKTVGRSTVQRRLSGELDIIYA